MTITATTGSMGFLTARELGRIRPAFETEDAMHAWLGADAAEVASWADRTAVAPIPVIARMLHLSALLDAFRGVKTSTAATWFASHNAHLGSTPFEALADNRIQAVHHAIRKQRYGIYAM